MCVLIVSNGYPTAHATAPADAPHDIASIDESFFSSPPSSSPSSRVSCRWSSPRCRSKHFLLKYSYDANHTPCGTPSLNNVDPKPLNATEAAWLRVVLFPRQQPLRDRLGRPASNLLVHFQQFKRRHDERLDDAAAHAAHKHGH